jgi:WS/DGAT/MGAT family acyltransferase
MKQLSALDTLFLRGETAKQAMNVSGLGIYDPSSRKDGSMDFRKVLEYAAERTRRSPLFRRMLVNDALRLDQPYWAEDSDFEIRKHVFHATLPKPGGRRELDQEVARIHARHISREGPLWEWWFIDGLQTVDGVPPGSFAVMFKLHHAAFDGVSAWEVISVSHDTQPHMHDEVLTDKALPATTTARAPSMAQKALRAYERVLRFPFDLAKTSWQSMPILRKLIKEDLTGFPFFAGEAPPTPLNGPLARRRAHRKFSVSLADLKRIRLLVPDTTVNDAVLAIIAGAMRGYLMAKKSLPKRSLKVGVPISIRAPAAQGAGGNQAILSITPLPTNSSDPVARLRAIRQGTSKKKTYVNDIPAHLLAEFMEFVPGMALSAGVRAFIDLGLARVFPLPYNLVVTNVPGSRVPLYFAGAKMLEYDACGPVWEGVRFLHVITSYLETVNISFDVASNHFDSDLYEVMLRKSLAELLNRTMPAVVPKKAKVKVLGRAKPHKVPSRNRRPLPSSPGQLEVEAPLPMAAHSGSSGHEYM